MHSQLEELLFTFKGKESTIEEEEEGENFSREIARKGPKTVSSQELQPKGDYGHNYRDTIPCMSQEQLEKELSRM